MIKQTELYWLIAAALLTFIPTLFIPHTGEEGVYTIASQEMLAAGSYWQPLLYGLKYPRPPLYNWLILAVTYLVGVKHILVAARIVTLLATTMLATLTGWFSWRLFKNKFLSILAVAIFLSGDLLFRRGWLAYSDPTFALFTFASMAWLWIALNEQKYRWLVLANIALFLGYLTKVHTVFLFYVVTAGVLCWNFPAKRKVLFSWQSVVIHAAAIGGCVLWAIYNTSGAVSSTVIDIWNLLTLNNVLAYGQKILVFPIQVAILYLPTSLLIAAWLSINKNYQQVTTNGGNWLVLKCLLLVVAINLLPYWLAPRTHVIRYLLPLYPLMAIILAYILYRTDAMFQNITIKFLWLGVILKLIVAIVWYPYELTVYRGDARVVAKQILNIVADRPLYINDSGSAGLRVAAEINNIRYPELPLQAMEESQIKRGYLLTLPELSNLHTNNSTVAAEFALGKDKIYLLEFK